MQFSPMISLLAAADFVEWLASLFRQPVEMIETALWSGLATGLGLLAAIPAVVYYNKLSSDADRIIAGYEAFADEFATILSRQLDS